MPSNLMKKLAKECKISEKRAEHLWDKAKEIAKSEGIPEGSDRFYSYVTGIVKKMIGQKCRKKVGYAVDLKDGSFISHAFDVGMKPVDLHKNQTEKTGIVNAPQVSDQEIPIDANFWLPLAAKEYNISPNLSDYILLPVPSVVTEIPNTNGDSVSKAELLKFNPELGMPAFKTWKAKACFLEHQNKDITKAKGVILDVFLRPIKSLNGNHAKLIKLLAFDRTKDPELCRSILKQEINKTSMGMYYSAYACSVCGNKVGKGFGMLCNHTQPRRKTYLMESSNQLVYRMCQGINGFETSLVADPSYINASVPNDFLMYKEKLHKLPIHF